MRVGTVSFWLLPRVRICWTDVFWPAVMQVSATVATGTGSLPASCSGDVSPLRMFSETCRTCDQTLDGRRSTFAARRSMAPATPRISTRRESWRVQAIHAAVVVGHHQGVLLIGAPYQCNSLLGATSGIGLELSPRDRICARTASHARPATAAAAISVTP